MKELINKVVDDEDFVRYLVRDLLSDEGFEVFHEWSATGGESYEGEPACWKKCRRKA